MKTPTDPLHITPETIKVIEFPVVNRHFGKPGYAEDDVDEFLDLVEERIAQLMRDNDALQRQHRQDQADLRDYDIKVGNVRGVLSWAYSRGETTVPVSDIWKALDEEEPA